MRYLVALVGWFVVQTMLDTADHVCGTYTVPLHRPRWREFYN